MCSDLHKFRDHRDSDKDIMCTALPVQVQPSVRELLQMKLVLYRKMITLLLLGFISLIQADSFDQAYSDLENYRTIYISGWSEF